LHNLHAVDRVRLLSPDHEPPFQSRDAARIDFDNWRGFDRSQYALHDILASSPGLETTFELNGRYGADHHRVKLDQLPNRGLCVIRRSSDCDPILLAALRATC
jgi:hypothetical protein